MTRRRRALGATGLAIVLLTLPGCATTPSGMRLGYASWSHLAFSLRMNWQQFVGWAPSGTTEDEATAAREGGWWGDEVPTLPAR